MDIVKLIESVRLCGSTPKVDQCKQCAYWSGGDMSKCIPRMTTDAAIALSTLQAENKSLHVLAELGNTRAKDYRVMRDRAVKAEEENKKLRAELEQVKAERDAAEVRHGHWIGEADDRDGHIWMECSECHKIRIVDDFCSACGTRMDKEAEHEVS